MWHGDEERKDYIKEHWESSYGEHPVSDGICDIGDETL